MYLNNDFAIKNVHYAGWKTVCHCISDIKTETIIDMYTDATFGWRTGTFRHLLPFNRDWVGFIHHPETGPNNVRDLFENKLFLDSLPFCKGLIVLSDDLCKKVNDLCKKVNDLCGTVPVFKLVHPTVTPELVFNYKAYENAPRKKIVHVGSWLRDTSLFEGLETGLEKTVLKGDLDNNSFDKLLSCNPVAIWLKDSSANNTVIECIVRGTPILINKLPSVVEYLGEEYPLYWENPVPDLSLESIKAASTFLKRRYKQDLSLPFFKKEFKEILDFLEINYVIGQLENENGTLLGRGIGVTSRRGISVSSRGARTMPVFSQGHLFY